MYQLLVPVDRDSTRAEEVIKTLTELPLDKPAVEVVILSVFEEMEGVDDIGGGVDTEELFDDVEPPKTVPAVASALEDHGYSVTVRREHGDPEDVILNVATDDAFDHVLMSARRRSPVGKTIFGSIAQSVILNVEKPVTVTVTED